MYEGKSHALFAKYAVPQMIGLLFNSVYMIVDGALSATGLAATLWLPLLFLFRLSRY